MSDQQSNNFSNLFSNTTTTPEDEIEKNSIKDKNNIQTQKISQN